jgi:carbon monoxide dehydrogenase subunit G
VVYSSRALRRGRLLLNAREHLPPDLVARSPNPIVRVELDGQGRPRGAIGACLVPAAPAEVLRVMRDVERFPQRIPMVHRVTVDGARLTMQLRFKVSLLSAKFGFVADVLHEGDDAVRLRYVSGEPRGIEIRLSAAPVDAGTAAYAAISFDIESLGWLVSFFLKTHPEIRFGVYPGCVLSLLDAVRSAVGVHPEGSRGKAAD